MQRHPSADPVEHPSGAARGQPFHQHRLAAVADREQHVLARRDVQVLHVRQRHLAQPVPPRRQRCDLQQPQADDEAGVAPTFEGAAIDQLPGDAQRTALRHPRAGTHRGERQRPVGRTERGQQPEGPFQHGLPHRRLAASNGQTRPSRITVRLRA
jgi:hypothetical protein